MSVAPASASLPVASAESDASCRVPLLWLFVSAALWLALGSAFSLIASIKFHAPGLLAGRDWLTYGRVWPVSTNAILYGFALPAGFGVALWLLARLGRTKLAWPGLLIVAALFWNFGVAVGLLGILGGDGTGFDWLEMPRYAWPMLFTAYLGIGLCGLLTFHRRRASELYVSQWFLLAALFWFPWIHSTANVLLTCVPVRGVVQAAVAWWFANNLGTICLGFLGLATIFYFIPKLTGRPLHSLYLAMFAFWTLALFGSWMGVAPGSPLPAWMPAVSTACAVLSLIPILAVGINCFKTLSGGVARPDSDPSLGFVVFGACAWVIVGVIAAVTAVPEVSAVTHFTWLERAQSQLLVFGFFAMTQFGAIYHIVPRLVPDAALCPKMRRVHFWCAALGTVALVVPLAVGGVAQGLALNHPDATFTDTMTLTLPYLRVSTLGDLLIAVGNVTLVFNFGYLLAQRCRACCGPAWKAVTTPEPQPAGATP